VKALFEDGERDIPPETRGTGQGNVAGLAKELGDVEGRPQTAWHQKVSL